MGGSPDVNFPAPSEEEKELQREQVALLRQQRDLLSRQMREQNLLAPFLFEEAGIEPIFGEDGEITGFTKVDDPTRELNQELELKMLQRLDSALSGELPISPTVERELQELESITEERIRKQLGPGGETSTPGIELRNRNQQTAAEIREAARRGDLSLFEQLVTSQTVRNRAGSDQFFNQIFGQNQNQLGLAGGLGAVAGGFNNPLSNLFANRSGEFQASAANAQASSNIMSSIFGGLGSIGGGLASNPGLFMRK